MGITSLILGIIAICIGFMGSSVIKIVGILITILGIVFGFIGKNNFDDYSIGGIVCSILGLLVIAGSFILKGAILGAILEVL